MHHRMLSSSKDTQQEFRESNYHDSNPCSNNEAPDDETRKNPETGKKHTNMKTTPLQATLNTEMQGYHLHITTVPIAEMKYHQKTSQKPRSNTCCQLKSTIVQERCVPCSKQIQLGTKIAWKMPPPSTD